MSMDWLRWYHGTMNDPKWRVISRRAKSSIPVVLSVWAAMLENASQAMPRGVLQGWNHDDVAAALDLEPEDVQAVYDSMQGKTLDGDILTGWGKRQPKREREDGTAADRKRAQREREKETGEPESHDPNDSVTPSHAKSRQVTPRLDEIREEETDRQTDAHDPDLMTVGDVMQTCLEAGARLNPAKPHTRQVASEIVAIGATPEDLREAIRKAQVAKQGDSWGLSYLRPIVGEMVEKRKNLITGGSERTHGGANGAGREGRKLSLGERATIARQRAEAAEDEREAHGELVGAHDPHLRAQVVERVR